MHWLSYIIFIFYYPLYQLFKWLLGKWINNVYVVRIISFCLVVAINILYGYILKTFFPGLYIDE